MTTPDDDLIAARLRRALEAEADMVDPSGDGLGHIRTGIEARRRRSWWRHPALALAAAAGLGLAAGGLWFGLTGKGSDDTTAVAGGGSPAPTSSTSPNSTPTPTSTPTSSAPTTGAPVPLRSTPRTAASTVTVPVYYQHDDGSGPRLYREFHRTRLVTDKITTALTQMFATPAQDPDYSSRWPKDATVRGVSIAGGTATVDLSRAATTANLSDAAADVALQQLVYTATAADLSVRKVKLTFGGRPVDVLWGHLALADRSFARAPKLDVQGLIWILAPRQGDRAASPVTVSVYGTAFEGNVTLKVLRGATEVTTTTVTTAMGEFASASTKLSLPAGSYSLRAYDDNAETGALVERDSKSFTVR